MSALLTGAAVVTPERILQPGWVLVDGGAIQALGEGDAPEADAERVDLRGSWLLPGFIDLHVHGGGGAWLSSGDPGEVLRAARFHLEHGTTRMLASVAAAPIETMVQAVAAVADLIDRGKRDALPLAGCHLEGPFLSSARCGAQDPEALIPPDAAVFEKLLDAGRGRVRTITLAVEQPGALDLVRQAVSRGVIPAVGHTDSSYAEAIAAIEAGASLATHLFNAMPPLHHREPGPVGACLHRSEVVCEVINDGIHLDGATVRFIFASAGPERIALITDAMAAAGSGDGEYQFGRVPMRVEQGVAMLADGSAIAGSTLTMDAAVRRAVRDIGLPIQEATIAASTTPARLLGLEKAGRIAAGADADLVVLDGQLQVAGVMLRGEWI